MADIWQQTGGWTGLRLISINHLDGGQHVVLKRNPCNRWNDVRNTTRHGSLQNEIDKRHLVTT